MADRKRFEPLAEIQLHASRFGGAGVAVFDNDLFPFVLRRVELIEAFDGQTFACLTILAQDVQDVEMPADLAVVAGLSDAVPREGTGIRDVGLAEFDEVGVSLTGVRHDLLDGLGAGLGLQAGKREAGVPENGGQEGEESLVPARAGSGRGGTGRCDTRHSNLLIGKAAPVRGSREKGTRPPATLRRAGRRALDASPESQKAPPTDQEMVDQRDSHRGNGSADTYGSTTMYL